jgi:hypothetical protein
MDDVKLCNMYNVYINANKMIIAHIKRSSGKVSSILEKLMAAFEQLCFSGCMSVKSIELDKC